MEKRQNVGTKNAYTPKIIDDISNMIVHIYHSFGGLTIYLH